MTPDSERETPMPRMKAVQISGKIYVEEPSCRAAVNAALQTRSDKIAVLDAENVRLKEELAERKRLHELDNDAHSDYSAAMESRVTELEAKLSEVAHYCNMADQARTQMLQRAERAEQQFAKLTGAYSCKGILD